MQQIEAMLVTSSIENASSRLGGLTLATTLLPAQAPAGDFIGLQMSDISDMEMEAMIASHMAAGQNEAADDRFGAGATVGRRHSHSVIAAHERRNIQHQVLLMCC